MKPQRKSTARRNARIAVIEYEGDRTQGTHWTVKARARYKAILKAAPGALSHHWNPTGDVEIVMDFVRGRIVIKAGIDVYVTVQDRDSPDANISDVQSRRGRLLYKKSNIVFSKDHFLASGKVIQAGYDLDGSGDLVDPINAGLSSAWRAKNKAMTWNYVFMSRVGNNVTMRPIFYIGGFNFFKDLVFNYFADYSSISLGPLIQLVAASYFNVTDELLAQYPLLTGYPKAIVSLWRTDLAWEIAIFGIRLEPIVNPYVSLKGFSGPAIYLPCTLPYFRGTVQWPLTVGNNPVNEPSPVSGFAYDGRTLLIASVPTLSDPTQKVYKVTFNTFYDDVTSEEIYNQTPYRIDSVNQTDFTGVVWDSGSLSWVEYNYAVNNTATLISGQPVIAHLSVDVDGVFQALRWNVTDHLYSYERSIVETTALSENTEDINFSSSAEIEIIQFVDTGINIVKTLSGIDQSHIKSLAMTSGPYSETKIEKNIEVNFYSARKNLIVYKTYTTTNTYSYTSGSTVNHTRTFFSDARFWFDTDTSLLNDTNVIVGSPLLSSRFPDSDISIHILNPDTNQSITDSFSEYSGIGGVLQGSLDKSPMIMIYSASNNNFLLSCYGAGASSGTLLVDYAKLPDYETLPLRIDRPVAADPDKHFFYPIGLTTKVFK